MKAELDFVEVNGNFYCKKCKHIKDYSEDPCENCKPKDLEEERMESQDAEELNEHFGVTE